MRVAQHGESQQGQASTPAVSGQVLIEGVETRRLKVIPDERGWLMELLRCDDQLFMKFGQVYVTAV